MLSEIQIELSIIRNDQEFIKQMDIINQKVIKGLINENQPLVETEEIKSKRLAMFFVDEASLLQKEQLMEKVTAVAAISLSVAIVVGLVGGAVCSAFPNSTALTVTVVGSGGGGGSSALCGVAKAIDHYFFERDREEHKAFFSRLRTLFDSEKEQLKKIKEIVSLILKKSESFLESDKLPESLDLFLKYRICYWIDQLGQSETEWIEQLQTSLNRQSPEISSLEKRMSTVFKRAAHDCITLQTPTYVQTYDQFYQANRRVIDLAFSNYLNSIQPGANPAGHDSFLDFDDV